MSNDFYVSPADLAPGTKARAGDINTIDQSVDAAFDKLPSEIAIKTGTVTYAQNTSKAVNAYAVALSPKVTTAWPIDGLQVTMLPVSANTGACTLNVNGLGNIAIKRQDGGDPIAGDLAAASPIILTYVASSNVFVLPSTANGQVAAAQAAAAQAAQSAQAASGSAGSASGSAVTANMAATTAVTSAQQAAQSAAAAAQTAANLNVDSQGNWYLAGKLGLGIANPQAKLHVGGSIRTASGDVQVSNGGNVSGSGGAINFSAQDTATLPMASIKGLLDWSNGTEEQGKLAFFTRPGTGAAGQQLVERLRLENNGNAGLGTTAPQQYSHGGSARLLEISNSDASLNSQAHVLLSTAYTAANSAIGSYSFVMPGLTNATKLMAYIGAESDTSHTSALPASNIRFAARTAGGAVNEIMRISGAGRVGINTATPGATLDVNGDAGFSTVTARAARVTHGQGAYLEWNKAGGDGSTYLLNQKGGGGGGIVLGEVDSNNSVTQLAKFISGTISTTSDAAFGAASIATAPSSGAYNNIVVTGDVIYKGGSTSVPVVLAMHNGSTIRCGPSNLQFRTANAASDNMTLDSSGNLLLGVVSGSWHRIAKNVTAGSIVLEVVSSNTGYRSAFFYGADAEGYNATGTAVALGRNVTSGRSLSAGGTINASGADYAEYMSKSDSCGVIAKGDIIGVNADGELTDKWADAVSFMIKSTDPSYVGGDTWGNAEVLGQPPKMPTLELPEFTGEPMPDEMPLEPIAPEAVQLVEVIAPIAPELPSLIVAADATDDSETQRAAEYAEAEQAYQAALRDYSAQVAANEQAKQDYSSAMEAYQLDMEQYEANFAEFWNILIAYDRARDAWLKAIREAREQFNTVAMPAYQAELDKFNASLDLARQKVDRIAYCGQVPVNVIGAKPGQYVLAAPDGDGIKGVLVDKADLNFGMYRDAVGIVQNILPDGRANVRVKPV